MSRETVVPARERTATLHLVQSSRLAKRLARLLLVGLFLSILAMAFLPWQQTSRGKGEVVAFVPQERQQAIESRVKGVVVRVADGLVEGSRVQRGEFILEIQPLASNQVEQLELQKIALQAKRDTASVQADAYADNITDLTEAMEFTISAANQMVEAARAKLRSKQELISRYEANELQARQAYERMSSLNEQGLKPLKEVEKAKKDWDGTRAELQSIHEEVEASELEVAAKEDEREEKRLLAQTKIDYAVAMQHEALGKVATAEKELAEIEISLTELSGLVITAPRDGTIFRMPVYEEGMIIKEGDPILTIVPDTTQNAVELFVNGNDMPLVQVGQTVR
ncbi:MAG: HlyD family efflux transporter periplasmic adaptor subunit, partial [Planctomycetota bacterium]